MNCPFCKTEYQSEHLVEGRCPRCGGVVAWTGGGGTDDFDPSEIQPKVTVSFDPRIQSQIRERIRESEKSPKAESSQKVSDRPATKSNDKVDKDPSSTVDTVPNKNSRRSTDVVEKVRRAWNDAASGIQNTLSTIRTDYDQNIDSLQVVVNERRMNGDQLQSLSSDYDLLEQIGQGAVGVVYAAQQNSIDRQVAVKMLQGDKKTREENKEKFLFEAVVTGDLDHPNIVPIHELGENQRGDLFYSMKKIDGKPWSDSISSRSLTQNLEILLKVCDALAFAHSRGIVHRDLKPENIMLGGYGEVLVVDWGIALPFNGYTKSQIMKVRPSISGTPAYMAPEMATGPIGKIGVTSDVYLLGAILFEIITGKPPHAGANAMECVIAAAKNQIAPVQNSGEPISIAMKAMSTSQANRYQTVREFKDAINEYQSHIESITLADRAEEAFEAARDSQDYQDYSRAIFAFEEALELWPQNEKAEKGIRKTNYEFARCALAKSDFELGLSRIDEEDGKSRALSRRLKKGLHARDRRKSAVTLFRNLVAVLLLTIIVGGAILIRQARKSEEEAKNSEAEAKNFAAAADDSREAAELEKEKADSARKLAEGERKKADKARETAVEEKIKADEARVVAESLRESEQERTYRIDLGGIKDYIQKNNFTDARKIVAKLKDEDRALLHWELGRVDLLCNMATEIGGPQQFEEIRKIDSIQSQDLGELVAVAELTGRFHLIDSAGNILKTLEIEPENNQAQINDLEFSPDGKWIAVAGRIENADEANESGSVGFVKTWKVDDLDSNPLTIPVSGTQVTSIAFSKVDMSILTAIDENSLKRWSFPKGTLLESYVGHSSVINDCQFTSDGTRFVTASDKDVRIWNIGKQLPAARFSEHQCSVNCVRFIEDNQVILSADSKGRLFRWTISKSSFADYQDNKAAESLIQQTRDQVEGLGKGSILTKFQAKRPDSDTRILVAHSDSINDLRISANAKVYLTAGKDNLVKLWSPESFQGSSEPLSELKGHGDLVQSAAFANNGRLVYSGGKDKQVRKWNLTDYQNGGIQTTTLRESRFLSASLNRQKDKIAIGRTDGSIVLRDLNESGNVRVLSSGHEYFSKSTIISSDRKTLISAAGDSTVRVWDFEKGAEKEVIPSTGSRGLLCISADGNFFATGKSGENSIQVFRMQSMDTNKRSPEKILTKEKKDRSSSDNKFKITSIDLSSTGKYLVAGDSGGSCYLWNVEQSKLLKKWRGHVADVVRVAFISSDDTAIEKLRLVSAGRECAVSTWTVESTRAKGTATESGSIADADTIRLLPKTIAPRKNEILSHCELNKERNGIVIVRSPIPKTSRPSTQQTTNKEDSVITIESVGLDGEERQSIELKNVQIHSICISPKDSKSILVAATEPNKTSRLYAWNGDSDSSIEAFYEDKLFSTVNQLVLLNETGQLLTVGGKGVKKWNLATAKIVMDYRSNSRAGTSAFSPDGSLLIVGGSEGAATIWNTEDGRNLARVQNPELGAVTASVFNKAKQFFLGDDKGQVFECLLDGSDRANCTRVIKHNESRINAIKISESRDWIITGGEDGLALAWDLESKNKVQVFEHEASIVSLAVSINERFLAVGLANDQIMIWDLDSGSKLAILDDAHSDPTTSLEFSDDNLRLLSCCEAGTLVLWDLTLVVRFQEGQKKQSELPYELNRVFRMEGISETLLSAHFINGSKDLILASDYSILKIKGKEVAPSFRVSKKVLEVERQSTSPVDNALTFSFPTDQDADNLIVKMELLIQEGEQELVKQTGSHFVLDSTSDPKTLISVSDGRIYWTNHENEKIELGQVKFENGAIEVSFTAQKAVRHAVSDVLRLIALKTNELDEAPSKVRITLLKMKAGQATSTPQIEELEFRFSEDVTQEELALANGSSANTGSGVEGQ